MDNSKDNSMPISLHMISEVKCEPEMEDYEIKNFSHYDTSMEYPEGYLNKLKEENLELEKLAVESDGPRQSLNILNVWNNALQTSLSYDENKIESYGIVPGCSKQFSTKTETLIKIEKSEAKDDDAKQMYDVNFVDCNIKNEEVDIKVDDLESNKIGCSKQFSTQTETLIKVEKGEAEDDDDKQMYDVNFVDCNIKNEEVDIKVEDLESNKISVCNSVKVDQQTKQVTFELEENSKSAGQLVTSITYITDKDDNSKLSPQNPLLANAKLKNMLTDTMKKGQEIPRLKVARSRTRKDKEELNDLTKRTPKTNEVNYIETKSWNNREKCLKDVNNENIPQQTKNKVRISEMLIKRYETRNKTNLNNLFRTEAKEKVRNKNRPKSKAEVIRLREMAAERKRRQRERIRRNKDMHEQEKAKERQRYKRRKAQGKVKLISDRDWQAQKKQREQWRSNNKTYYRRKRKQEVYYYPM